MNGLQGARVLVVGAGVVGLCVSLELQGRGACVTLMDADARSPNASAVAAGMIAPGFESSLEEAARGRLELLRSARDLWLDVADGAVSVHRDGALWVAPPGREAELETVGDRLQREGAAWERLSTQATRELSSGLTGELAGAVFTPEDWRLDAGATLKALADAFAARGGRRLSARLSTLRIEAATTDALVLCAGWSSRTFAEDAPELACLRPVGGELVRFPGAPPAEGPVVRARGGYLVPGASGVVAGASMVEGGELIQPTPEGQSRYVDFARGLFPGLKGAAHSGSAGVRAATPDGLPLVGRSRSGVHLATGFRRNGWLLAPLAAKITADQLAGRDPGPWAKTLRPDRFN